MLLSCLQAEAWPEASSCPSFPCTHTAVPLTRSHGQRPGRLWAKGATDRRVCPASPRTLLPVPPRAVCLQPPAHLRWLLAPHPCLASRPSAAV